MKFQYLSICRDVALALLLTGAVSCSQKESETSAERQPVRVKTVTVANGSVETGNTYSGTVEEGTGTVVSFTIPGTVKTINVAEGDRVHKGQLIATLDDNSLKNSYDIALATLDQARDAYRRMKMLHDSNSLPEIKWVEMESKLRQAESAAEIARIALDDAKLYAPVSGIVAEKSVSAGQNVAPGLPVVNIIDISAVKVEITLPDTEISSIPAGSTAEITLSNFPGETFTGRLAEKGVVANPLSRAYVVKYTVDNRDGRLLPGMICEVRLNRVSSSEGIILPASSILLAADNTTFVWTDSAGVARKRNVLTGAMLPKGIVVSSGLNNGDKVIVAGMEKVSQNTPVTSIN